GVGGEAVVELAACRVRDGIADVAPFTVDAGEQRPQVEARATAGDLAACEQVDAPDGVVERAQAEGGQVTAHLFRDVEQVRLDHLGRGGELRAQLGPLARDPDRTRVHVAGAHHQAAL